MSRIASRSAPIACGSRRPRSSRPFCWTSATFDVVSATLLPSADEAFVTQMQASIRAMQRNGGWDMLYAAINLPKWFPRPGMDDEQLVDNLLTFYLAGHETTAKALGWTLYLLARSPQWMDRVAGEVREVTGGEALTAAHVE